jgi:glycosyltransferase involved in cell wall biosynthesis
MNYVIGIDASRCRSGGAFAHLIGILNEFKPNDIGIYAIHVWSHKKLLDVLPDKKWLIKHNPSFLQKRLLFQIFWQAFILKKDLNKYNCKILFTLDASTFCRFNNQIILSQDMLSYEPGIMSLFGFGIARLRLHTILFLQNAAFRRAMGVIFLTKYASNVIQQSCGLLTNYCVIPHGIGNEFKQIDKKVEFNSTKLIKCLYISNTDHYKYQWHVVKSIELLRKSGLNIALDLVGGGNGSSQKILEKQIKSSDPTNSFIRQFNFVHQSELPNFIIDSDIFVFASGCENMPVTLLEAMASGIPIACSNRGPMPEILENAGIYFDPEDPNDIAKAIKKLTDSLELRLHLSNRSRHLAQKYSWLRCAEETFSFILNTYNKNNHI